MDQQAATLLTTLKRTSAASELKLTQLNNLKSDIKHHKVPDTAQPTIFECLRVAIAQQTSSTLATHAFTTLGHLIKRLKIQDPDGAAIAHHAPKLFTALLERLGDLRENHRNAASQTMADLWPYCGQEVERIIREDAMTGSNVRAKDTAMQWVVNMNREEALPFKGFVPFMVANLEDHDGTVRDAAKGALIDLFRGAPERAKIDLKKQLKIHGVRTGITSQILAQIDSDKPPAPEGDMTMSTRSLPALDHTAQFAESINSEAARPPPPEEIPMDPIFVHSQRELEDMFRDMLPPFEGRESEENWVARDKNTTKLRRLLKGNAPADYHAVFMPALKQLQEGIIKVAISLRTTMSSNGCHLVQEMARTLGPAIDPMVEIYLQTFIKASASTKNIAAQNANQTVDTIFQYVSYNTRIMQHVWHACQDKNVQPRTFAAGWLRTILSRQTGTRSHFESSGGLELAEKSIKHGLNDPQPKVKEAMRATYWTLFRTWPDRAQLIMNTLDPKAKTALEKDSHNPNAPTGQGGLRASTTSRAGGSASRASVREAMLAARKNLAKSQSERPNSAMATVSPAPTRSKSSTNLSNRQPSAPASAASARVPSTASSSSSTNGRGNALMSGAARRPAKRPEIPRPATADPYATRRIARPETPSIKSPVNTPRQENAMSHAGSSTVKGRIDRSSPLASPLRSHLSPANAAGRTRPSSRDSKSSENFPNKEDEFSIVASGLHRSQIPTSPRSTLRRPTIDKTFSVDSGLTAAADDDNFTLVLPTVHKSQNEQLPNVEHSPLPSSDEAADPSIPSDAPQLAIHQTLRSSERNDSPVTETPQEALPHVSSPLKETEAATTPAPVSEPAENGFQIHEDPFMDGTEGPKAHASPRSQEIRVLNEVPVNEFSQPAVTDSPHGDESPKVGESPPQSPQNKAESMRSRKLLMSGIERIRGRTLDAHGFRKVLELIRSSESGDIFGSVGEGRRFDDLCSVLLDYIVEPSESMVNPNVRHTQELKRQATSIMRTVLNAQQPTYKKWIASGRWYPRVLTGTLDARRNVDGLGLLVKDLEALASDIVTKIHPEEGEKAIMEWLEQVMSDGEQGEQQHELDGAVPTGDARITNRNKATAFALRNLSALLATTTASALPLSHDLSERAGHLTVVSLRSKDAEVRKAAVDLATQMHTSWPTLSGETQGDDAKGDFWAMLERNGLQESARNLIVYFIARKERSE